MSWLFTSGGQSVGASVSVLPMNIQGWFPLGLTSLISLQSKRLSRVFSVLQFKSFNSLATLKVKVKVKSLSRVWLFETPWTVAHLALLSMGFSRQEYWSGLPFPSPGNLPNPGIKPRSPALQAGALTLSILGKNKFQSINKRDKFTAQGSGPLLFQNGS